MRLTVMASVVVAATAFFTGSTRPAATHEILTLEQACHAIPVDKALDIHQEAAECLKVAALWGEEERCEKILQDAIAADSKDCIEIDRGLDIGRESVSDTESVAPSGMCNCCADELKDYEHKDEICSLPHVELFCAGTCGVEGGADVGFSLKSKYVLQKVKSLKDEKPPRSNDDIVKEFETVCDLLEGAPEHLTVNCPSVHANVARRQLTTNAEAIKRRQLKEHKDARSDIVCADVPPEYIAAKMGELGVDRMEERSCQALAKAGMCEIVGAVRKACAESCGDCKHARLLQTDYSKPSVSTSQHVFGSGGMGLGTGGGTGGTGFRVGAAKSCV